ncbi:hypothetical protein CDD83_2024 [Cordyceps sp. RAO-2017]|nr:hypothetical protein CDD83_2024 [Cordyceps sp. RAO-2017]
MASQFIGLHMRVVLRDPPGYHLSGIVRDVEAGNSLSLTNVYMPATRERTAQMKIVASNIADLSEIVHDDMSPTSAAAPEPVVAPAAPPPPAHHTFVDPAILSMGRRPASGTPSASGLLYHSDRAGRQKTESDPVPPAHPDSGQANRRSEQDLLDSIKGLRLDTPPRQQQHNNNGNNNGAHHADLRETPLQKKKARSRNTKQPRSQAGDQAAHAVDGSPAAIVQSAHGKGWRQTPILESNST